MSRSRRTKQKNRRKRPAPRVELDQSAGSVETPLERAAYTVLSFLGKAFFLVLLLAPSMGMAVPAFFDAVPEIQLALDGTAAPGTVTVQSCEYREYSNSSDRWRYCEGTFVHDDTGEAVRVTAYDSTDPGDVYPARITFEGDDAGLRDVRGVLAPLFEVFIGLILVGISLAAAAAMDADRWMAPLLVSSGTLVVLGILGMIASTVASA